MVFIALPALQRNQRDTQRKQDLSRLNSAVQNFQSNNRGLAPTRIDLADNRSIDARTTSFLQRYVANDEFADPSGRVYVLWNLLGYSADHPGMSYTSSGGGMTPIYYFYDAICDGGQSVAKMGSNNIAFVIVLEGGGSYCVSN